MLTSRSLYTPTICQLNLEKLRTLSRLTAFEAKLFEYDFKYQWPAAWENKLMIGAQLHKTATAVGIGS